MYPDFFFLSFNFVWGGSSEICKKIWKKMHYFMRDPRNYRKMWILHFCPKDLCLRLSEFWSLKKKSVFSILPTPYTTCNNRGQNTLGDKWQQHIMVTDHSMCTGQATSCSNMSRRHVAATNRFVCTGELFWKSLTPKQNFVAAISRKKSNRLNLCHLLQRKMHFTGLKTTENWLFPSHLFFRQSRT